MQGLKLVARLRSDMRQRVDVEGKYQHISIAFLGLRPPTNRAVDFGIDNCRPAAPFTSFSAIPRTSREEPSNMQSQ
ncbi:hypothetical protein RB195_015208 [Necator americanus]|uniref:Uncharacterized protein n=1 Tax=Necator americanus TaxID=51031 RepID=A0ABR1E400_NECAM